MVEWFDSVDPGAKGWACWKQQTFENGATSTTNLSVVTVLYNIAKVKCWHPLSPVTMLPMKPPLHELTFIDNSATFPFARLDMHLNPVHANCMFCYKVGSIVESSMCLLFSICTPVEVIYPCRQRSIKILQYYLKKVDPLPPLISNNIIF